MNFKIRGTTYQSKKILGLLKIGTKSNFEVFHDSHICKFDFHQNQIFTNFSSKLSFACKMVCPQNKHPKKVSEIEIISSDTFNISIQKPRGFSLFPQREIVWSDSRNKLIASSLISTANLKLSMASYLNAEVDHVYRWIDCQYESCYTQESIILCSYFYLFHSQFDVSVP